MWLTPRMAFAMLARGALEASICLAALPLVITVEGLQRVLASIGTEATPIVTPPTCRAPASRATWSSDSDGLPAAAFLRATSQTVHR